MSNGNRREPARGKKNNQQTPTFGKSIRECSWGKNVPASTTKRARAPKKTRQKTGEKQRTKIPERQKK